MSKSNTINYIFFMKYKCKIDVSNQNGIKKITNLWIINLWNLRFTFFYKDEWECIMIRHNKNFAGVNKLINI